MRKTNQISRITVIGDRAAVPESAKDISRSFAIDAPRTVEREIRNTP